MWGKTQRTSNPNNSNKPHKIWSFLSILKQVTIKFSLDFFFETGSVSPSLPSLSLSGPGYPRTCYAYYAGLELPASACWVLWLKVCTTTPDSSLFLSLSMVAFSLTLNPEALGRQHSNIIKSTVVIHLHSSTYWSKVRQTKTVYLLNISLSPEFCRLFEYIDSYLWFWGDFGFLAKDCLTN